MWYFIVAGLVYICFCIGLHIAHYNRKLDKFDIVLGSALGIPLSCFWPIFTSAFVVFFLTRYLATVIVKRFYKE